MVFWNRAWGAVLLALLPACGDKSAPTDATTAEAAAGAATWMDVPVEVALGRQHGCVRYRKGRVACWSNDNNAGQVGDSDALGNVKPKLVYGLDDAIMIAARHDGTCAVRENGSVICWGTVSAFSIYSKVDVARGLSGVKRIAMANEHVCALLESGKVTCTGSDVEVEGAVDLAASENGVCALLSTGRIVCWAFEHGSAQARPPKVVAGIESARILAVREQGGCAILASGALACWDEAGAREGPIPRARDLAMGASHACAIDATDRLACWGQNPFGQLGAGTRDEIAGGASSGVARPDAPGPFVRVAVSDNSSCGLLDDGRLYCWGAAISNKAVTIKTMYESPVLIPGLAGVETIASTHDRVCATTSASQLFCWGSEDERGAAPDFPDDRVRLEPVPAAREVVSSVDEYCAIDAQREVTCKTVNSLSFKEGPWQKVEGLRDVVAISGNTVDYGNASSCCESYDDQLWYAVDASGSVKAWVTPTGRPRTAAYAIEGITGAKRVITASAHACAVVERGLSCWGQVGLFLKLVGPKPAGSRVKVVHVAGVTDALSGDDELVLRQSGRVTRIKDDGMGRVAGVTDLDLSDVAALDTGGNTACFAKKDGSLWCSEREEKGKRVPGIEDATAVAVGGGHACAITRDREVKCWGENDTGAIGQPALPLATRPIEIELPH
jgi:alpha-tubulin suppressor-like RCC1 family protein